MPMADTLRIWDCFFLEGVKMLFRCLPPPTSLHPSIPDVWVPARLYCCLAA
jgi:hypothetical protein